MSDSEEYEDFGSGDESLDENDSQDLIVEKSDNEKPPEEVIQSYEDLNHEVLSRKEAKLLLEGYAEHLIKKVEMTISIAKSLLMKNKWNLNDALKSYEKTLLCDKLVPKRQNECTVCGMNNKNFLSPSCGHGFCRDCWKAHARMRLMQRMDVCCMDSSCEIILTETAVYPLVSGPLAKRFELVLFDCSILSHPRLRFCPGVDCDKVIMANEIPNPKRVTCSSCFSKSCFMCGLEFHLPAHCSIIKAWLQKCSDDSETANYISTNTKDCPECASCIEKSGGCNHMLCSQCGFDFCWICGGPWKEHGAQYYECSKFKETGVTLDINEARSALAKYLHYYQRWDNHCRSIRLEKKFQKKLEAIAKKEVEGKRGSWIDWEHLKKAGKLLAECRYTLKYTYPRAYFMPLSKEKVLFEYQQGVLEAECEDLAWKLERPEKYSIAELEQAKAAAAKSRLNLVKSTSH